MGVAENSAREPSSVSSFHRTPRFAVFVGDFFLGLNATAFLAGPSFRRLGEFFMGDIIFNGEDCTDDTAGASKILGLGMDLIGDGPIKLSCRRCFGVPDLLGAKTSVTGSPPSGLMTCDVAVVQAVMIWPSNRLAALIASSSGITMI